MYAIGFSRHGEICVELAVDGGVEKTSKRLLCIRVTRLPSRQKTKTIRKFEHIHRHCPIASRGLQGPARKNGEAPIGRVRLAS